jgi:radical SAM superfamily enzyme YgiQ (UPF0313 family)
MISCVNKPIIQTKNKMKLTLIRPNLGIIYETGISGKKESFWDEGRMEPLELATLAALTPSDVEISMYDDRIESVLYDEPTDLVAISVEIFAARRAYEISAEYRKRNIPVILGGVHPTLIPEEAAQHADSVFIGDGEMLWNQVIEDAKNKKLKPIYRAQPCNPHPGLFPRRTIYQNKKYLPISLMQFGRGCPYGCSYCATSVYFDKKHYLRKIDEVVREIESLKKQLIFFVDDNIVANPTMAKELFKALIPLRISWVSQASIDMADDPELMKLMVKSGCMGHVVGFESITKKGLISINKKPNLDSFDNYDRPLKIFREHGLQLWAAFILGHDEETPETIYQTVEFAKKHKFPFAAYNIITPYPNTPFYEQLKRENRLLYDGKWWLHPDYQFNSAAFIPKHMSPEELTNHCFQIKKDWNSFPTILQRMFTLANLKSLSKFLFLSKYNLLYRQESLKKHRLKLGYK